MGSKMGVQNRGPKWGSKMGVHNEDQNGGPKPVYLKLQYWVFATSGYCNIGF
jgi:hypothetical protein